MCRPEEIRPTRPALRGQPQSRPVQRGGNDRQATVGTHRGQATDSVHRLHRVDIQSVRGRRRAQVRAELALLDR